MAVNGAYLKVKPSFKRLQNHSYTTILLIKYVHQLGMDYLII